MAHRRCKHNDSESADEADRGCHLGFARMKVLPTALILIVSDYFCGTTMLLTPSDIESLLRQEPITDEWPWNTMDETTVHGSIKDIIAEIRRKNHLQEKTEFGHYGSGYASYVDCWLYRANDAFRFDEGNCYWGLVVLFSTLSKYYVIGEGQKAWHTRGGSSYLPSFQFVDSICHPAVQKLTEGVCGVLAGRGLVRVSASEVSSPLAAEIKVPTILADRPWCQFDALYYWED
jgi:hypothetical protein